LLNSELLVQHFRTIRRCQKCQNNCWWGFKSTKSVSFWGRWICK